MTIRLNELSTVLLFGLVGAVLWMLKHNVTVVTVPEWATEISVEEEDLPTWGDLN